MKAGKLPVSELILSCVYIGVGAIGFAFYFPELMATWLALRWEKLRLRDVGAAPRRRIWGPVSPLDRQSASH